MNRIRIAYPDENIGVTAQLLTDKAPKTCEAVLRELPVDGESCHGMYSGPEIFCILPRVIDIGMENATSVVLPGEIGFLTLPGGIYHSFDQSLSEIIWFYGRGAKPSMPDGPCRVNVFAVIEEKERNTFFEVCARQQREGVKRVKITRGYD